MKCDVCDRPMNHRSRTGLCSRCREDGAAFARAWADDLTAGGLSARETAEVLGVDRSTVYARHRERRGQEPGCVAC